MDQPSAILALDAPTTTDAPTATDWLGDVLVSFGVEAPPPRRPAAPWAAAGGAAAPSRVWEAPPAPDWRGAPVMRLAAGDWTAWLLGELYGAARTPADVLAVLDGRLSPNALNGHFLLLAHDARAGEWHAWTNRLATFHAYYAHDGRRAALGTCFRAVAAAARPDLDWEALTGFCAYGFCPADRTFLADVRILRPATHYRFDARVRLLSAERYWQWHYEPDHGRAYDATVDAFAERFQAVMDDLLADGHIALPISGGLDSRSTVAAVRPGSPVVERVWSYSYGYGDDSVETRIAGQVAAARGLNFHAFTVQPYLFARLPRVLASVEGFQDITQARQATVVDAIGAHCDYVIAAHWGDVYLDDMGVGDAPGALVAMAAHKFHKPGSDWLLAHLGRPHLGRAETEEMLHGLLAAELARIPALGDADFTIKALKAEQWSARWTTASLRMYQSAAFPRLPFYDTRLIDFFTTVPTAYVAGRRLQIDYLRRAAPDLARVPWQATGRDLFDDGGFSPRVLTQRVARKARAVATGRRVLERNWEVQFLGRDGRAGLNEWLLRPGRRLHALVPAPAVADLLASFERDPWADKRSYAVAQLLTLSAWLDYMAGDLDR